MERGRKILLLFPLYILLPTLANNTVAFQSCSPACVRLPWGMTARHGLWQLQIWMISLLFRDIFSSIRLQSVGCFFSLLICEMGQFLFVL